MRYNRDEYRRDWHGVDWSKSYSAHRRQYNVSPLREWVMAFSIVAMVIGAIMAAMI
jgi:hypothetical protein